MLRELIIRNFAVIDGLELSFGPGLSCLTGETGAGKSILVDAISAALGGKMGSDVLRAGEDTSVEAEFDISGMPEVAARLAELGLDGPGEPGGELIIRRAVSGAGRGKVYINGSLANISTLQEIGESLVDIHGQHEHQSLLRVGTHLGLLDTYLSLGARVGEYAEAYEGLASLLSRAAELSGREKERSDRLDLLRYQASEIDSAGLSPEEDEGLPAERARLMHADRLKTLASSALEALRDSDASALALLTGALKAAREIASIVPGQEECARLLESAEVSAGEASAYLRDFGGSLEADPDRLTEVEGRLDTLSKLKKKYGGTVSDVLAYRARIDGEIAGLEGSGDELAGISQAVKAAEAELRGLARALSGERQKGAGNFCARVVSELKGLGMGRARFEVSFADMPEPGPRGLDRAEFLFSANEGQEPKPLARIASGGELSRVMLALKVILAGADRVPTLIFDEVDTGVGGDTAGAVGMKLREVSAGRQVLCITHLPQIASLAESHYHVGKQSEGGRTIVSVTRLDKEGRVKEVARMLGGEGSKTASAHAKALVNQGDVNG